MKNHYKRILRTHGIVLSVLGAMMTFQSLLGSFKGVGLLKFLKDDALRSVGLFEAYLLAGYSGFVIILLSGKIYKKEWHLLPATVHAILFITNILFWKAYAIAGIVTVGYISTSAHALFILLETVCYFKIYTHEQKVNLHTKIIQ